MTLLSRQAWKTEMVENDTRGFIPELTLAATTVLRAHWFFTNRAQYMSSAGGTKESYEC